MASNQPEDRFILQNVCNGCLKSENIELKTCSQCHIMKYCSETCQKENFPDHKKDCKKIKKLTDNVERLAGKLRSYSDFGQPAENYFEAHVGHFWGLVETRDYCRARLELADEIYRVLMLKNVILFYGYISADYCRLLQKCNKVQVPLLTQNIT